MQNLYTCVLVCLKPPKKELFAEIQVLLNVHIFNTLTGGSYA
jgi:hypothetical protein